MGMRRDTHTSAWVLVLAIACCLGSVAMATAATLYVDCHNVSGTEDGTLAHPYSSIGEAVTAAVSGDTIYVSACVYIGDITIDSKNLTLRGVDPAITTIQGFSSVITVSGTILVEIAGFTIQGGANYGIRINAGATGLVHNCILTSNTIGIAAIGGSAVAKNNVITGSSNIGGYTVSGGTLSLISNILVGNSTGAYANSSTTVSSSYNNYWMNTTNKAAYPSCCCGSCPPVGSVASINDLNVDSLFVSDIDFHLQPGSPCIDTGSPASVDKDADGTRNDMGIYGGPGGAFPWPSIGGPDLLWRNTGTGDLAVWFMNGETLLQSKLMQHLDLIWQTLGVGDLNGDGKADLVLRNTSTGDVAVWLMSGETVLQSQLLPRMNLEWQVVGVKDLNGDGKADLVLRNTRTGDVAIWFMNGTTLLKTKLLPHVGLEWQLVGVGNLNGDGLVSLP